MIYTFKPEDNGILFWVKFIWRGKGRKRIEQDADSQHDSK